MKNLFRGRLRNKIFLMMALVSVVPVFAAGFLSVYSIRASHKESVANLEDTLINQQYAEIKNFVDEAGTQNTISTSEEGGPTLDSQIGAVTGFLKIIIDGYQPLEESYFVSVDGKETIRFSQSYTGGVPIGELRDLSNIEGFLTAKAGKQYFGPVYYTLKGPMMSVATPARNKSGSRIIGVIGGELKLSHLRELMGRAKLGNSGYVYLVDKDGFLISNSSRIVPVSSFKKIGIVGDVLKKHDFLGSDGQRRYLNFGGVEVVAAGRFLPEYGWGLIAEWPATEADKSVNDILYKNILVLLAVIVAVVFVSILLATLIVRPIQMLEQGTERVSQGKFDEGVDIQTHDELEELGGAFNKMMQGLKQLQELKDEFVFIAAHELRTPVAAMKGYLTLILDGITGPVTEKTKDFIQKVINSNNRLIQLVNDLLEVARSEAGRLTIKVSAIDIVQPIKEVLSELQSLADKSSVKLIYEPAVDIPKAMADSDRLKEVIVNLVGNSIKYMGGAGTVTISHELTAHELITHVNDTGLGMSKESQAKLFEKFYRVQTEKTKDVTGTGLGLFIVKEIMEKMNGRIFVESEEGKGSTFSFSLPVAG